MSEQAPMTPEEYIKAAGIQGNKLIVDVDKAHAKALAGDVYETIAQRHGRAAEYLRKRSPLDKEFIDNGEYNYKQAREKDIVRRAGEAMIEAS